MTPAPSPVVIASNPADSSPSIATLHSVRAGLFTVDREWIIQYWNSGMEAFSPGHGVSMPGQQLTPATAGFLPPGFFEHYTAVLAENHPPFFQHRFPAPGNDFDLSVIYDYELLTVFLKGPCHHPDITPDLSGNPLVKELQAQTELYRAVAEVTSDCLWNRHIRTKEIFWIDGGHKREFGYDVENTTIPQGFWEDRIHEEDRENVLMQLEKAWSEKTRRNWGIEYRFKKADGYYAFVKDKGHIIRDEEGQAIRMIGTTANVTKVKMLEAGLEKQRLLARRQLTEAVLDAQEKERSSIGEELHDNLNQILAVTKLYIQLGITADDTREVYLRKSIGLVADVMNEIRRIAKYLLIPRANIIGLQENIKNLIWDISQVHDLKMGLHYSGLPEESISEKLQVNLFRIIQEQTTNILKHSGATIANISIIKTGPMINLTITDNGKGHEQAKNHEGVGLINIRSRADLFDGRVEVVTSPDKGYELRVWMQDVSTNEEVTHNMENISAA